MGSGVSVLEIESVKLSLALALIEEKSPTRNHVVYLPPLPPPELVSISIT